MSRFVSKPTTLYRQTVDLLRQLEETEGKAERAYAEAVWERYRDAWAKRHGLKQTNGHVCVRRLLAGRCNRMNCIFPPANDHHSLWLRGGKPAVYVFQPYGLSHEQLCALVGFAEEHGLRLRVDTFPAWHFPGAVLCVELWLPGKEGF
ncbi:MAG: hypothetical protein AB1330_03525 [Bacillota bacterium]